MKSMYNYYSKTVLIQLYNLHMWTHLSEIKYIRCNSNPKFDLCSLLWLTHSSTSCFNTPRYNIGGLLCTLRGFITWPLSCKIGWYNTKIYFELPSLCTEIDQVIEGLPLERQWPSVSYIIQEIAAEDMVMHQQPCYWPNSLWIFQLQNKNSYSNMQICKCIFLPFLTKQLHV